jgi:hypothetical protein
VNARPLTRVLYRLGLRLIAPFAGRLDGAANLFLFAHPRCGSTLFTHLLANHPEIAGYGETHIDHHPADGARRFRADLLWHRPDLIRARPRFVLDKILSGARFSTACAGVLRPPSDRALFLVREPRGTYASMRGGKFQFDDARAVEAYEGRMEWLAGLAGALAPDLPKGWLTYADLVRHPAGTLESIRSFLGLSTSISQTYRTFRSTGRPNVGDASENIFTGVILAKEPPAAADIPSASLARLESAHAACLANLSARCTPLGAGGTASNLDPIRA